MKIYTEISSNTWITSEDAIQSINTFKIVPFIEGIKQNADQMNLICDDTRITIAPVADATRASFIVNIPDDLTGYSLGFTLSCGNFTKMFQMICGLTSNELVSSLQNQLMIDLQDKYNSSLLRFDDVNQKFHDALGQIADLQMKIDTLNAKLSTMIDAEEANLQIANLRSQLSSKNAVISQKDTEIANLMNDTTNLQGHNDNLQTQIDQLKTQVDNFRSGYLQFGSVVSVRSDNILNMNDQIGNDITRAINNSNANIDSTISYHNQTLSSFDKANLLYLVKTYSNSYITGAKTTLSYYVVNSVSNLNTSIGIINSSIIDRINLRQPTIDAWINSSDYGQRMYASGLNDTITWLKWLSQYLISSAANAVTTLSSHVTEVGNKIDQIAPSFDSIPFPSVSQIDKNNLKINYVYSSQIPSEINLLLSNSKQIINETQS